MFTARVDGFEIVIKIDFLISQQKSFIRLLDRSFLFSISFVLASYFPGAVFVLRACMTIQSMLIYNMIKLLY